MLCLILEKFKKEKHMITFGWPSCFGCFQACLCLVEHHLGMDKCNGELLSNPSIYHDKLLYLTTSRPNISYSVQVITQLSNKP